MPDFEKELDVSFLHKDWPPKLKEDIQLCNAYNQDYHARIGLQSCRAVMKGIKKPTISLIDLILNSIYSIHPFDSPVVAKRSESQDEFEVCADERLDNLQQQLDLSGSPSASLHFEIDGYISKRTLTAWQVAVDSANAPSDTAKPLNPVLLPTKSPDGKTLYAIASFTKNLLTVACHRIISAGKYKHRGLSWDRSAGDVFNDRRRDRGASLIRQFSRDPTILELLLNRNRLALMSQYFLVPDGSLTMSKEEFLYAAPLILQSDIVYLEICLHHSLCRVPSTCAIRWEQLRLGHTRTELRLFPEPRYSSACSKTPSLCRVNSAQAHCRTVDQRHCVQCAHASQQM